MAGAVLLFSPGEALAGIIASAWSYEAARDPHDTYLVTPDGQLDVLFSMRRGRPALMVVGTHERASWKPTAGLDLTIAFRLHAGAAPALFDLPAAHLTGSAVSLDELWGPAARSLLDALSAPAPVAARVALLRSALARRAHPARSSARLVRAAARAWASHLAEPRLAHLASRLGLSERHLRRVFTESVGLSPIALRRVLRLQRVLASAQSPSRPAWAHVAADAGYFDQAHLIADCKALLGTTPEALRRQLTDRAPVRAPVALR